MHPHDEPFVPETVDQKVDQFLQIPQQQTLPASAEMVQMLQSIYAQDPRLQRIWDRLQHVEQRSALHLVEGKDVDAFVPNEPFSTLVSSSSKKIPRKTVSSTHIYKEHPKKRASFQQRLGLLAAILLLVALIGSMAMVLHFSHLLPSGLTASSATLQSAGPITTTCPSSGFARAAFMPAMQLGNAQTIIYLDTTTSTLKSYTLPTHVTTTIVNQAGTIDAPQLSNDGQWLLYVLVTKHTSVIQLIRVDGKYQQTLYCAPANTTLGDKTNLQWSPDQKLLIFAQTNLSTHLTSLDLLNLSTGRVQVELTPPAASIIYQPRTWLDDTRVYVTMESTVDGPPSTLQILDTGKGAQQTENSLQMVLGVSDTPWDFDSTYDGSKLFVVYADPAAGRAGPGTYCQISAFTTSGQNGAVIFNSTTLVPDQLRVAGYGSSILLLSINRAGDPADLYNGLWKLNADGTGLTQLTNQPSLLNEFSQYPWSNVSRDGHDYTYGTSFGSLSGGTLTPYTSAPALVVGWTTR
jgi:hypothetical protein